MDVNIHEILAELDGEIMLASKKNDDRKAYGMIKAKNIILRHGRIV